MPRTALNLMNEHKKWDALKKDLMDIAMDKEDKTMTPWKRERLILTVSTLDGYQRLIEDELERR